MKATIERKSKNDKLLHCNSRLDDSIIFIEIELSTIFQSSGPHLSTSIFHTVHSSAVFFF